MALEKRSRSAADALAASKPVAPATGTPNRTVGAVRLNTLAEGAAPTVHPGGKGKGGLHDSTGEPL